MATYFGFSTIEYKQQSEQLDSISGTISSNVPKSAGPKKFKLTDKDIVIRDLLNAFSIRAGTKPGNPGYGTTIWDYLFEPNTTDIHAQIEQEIRRVIEADPRLIINTVDLYSNDNELLIQMEIAIAPFNEPIDLAVSLNKSTGKATAV